MLVLLIALFYAVGSGFLLSVAALYLIGAKKARFGKDNAACFVGIFIGVYIWVVLISPIVPNSIYLGLFLIGATPIAALPALIFYGPGKK